MPVDTTPVPFTSLNLDQRLLEGIRDLGFRDTRPIQTAVIPLALANHDLIACAETGTGKTAAFVVPTLQWLLTTGARDAKPAAESVPPGDATAAAKSRVLVLAPTRELAVQIEDEIHGLAYHTNVTSAAVYGGVEMGMQERALKAGVDIIVATPGRLMDHMRQQNADLSAIELLVLDEADRMMDMGFWPDVRRIISSLPGVRQTLLFSATMPDEVVKDALEITREAKYVQVGQRSAAGEEHHPPDRDRRGQREGGVADRAPAAAGRPGADLHAHQDWRRQLARKLAAAGVKCTALHADRSQDQRRHRRRRVQGREVQGPGRHRHRRPRPRHRRHPHRHQLRSA